MQEYRVLRRAGRSARIARHSLFLNGTRAGAVFKRAGKSRTKAVIEGCQSSVESEVVHFFQSLIRRQFFKGHAVAGNKNAGAVVAVVAVHENFFLRIVAENEKEIARPVRSLEETTRSPGCERSECPMIPLFFLPSRIFAGSSPRRFTIVVTPSFFSSSNPAISGLRAAVQMIIDLSGIRDTGDAKFFAVRGVHRGRRGWLHLLLRGEPRSEERKAKASAR